ncbi:hemolysin-III related-domain-containing protein [Protomyces lactucae-debilis]|uniref:Hemolysin-III related-domain-containing protein n=1 Tax=Protomyces lactucae-debilis TaxID=2754530 RepID=A0A1Y2FY29_PROLT|nr:hemolysin-III related-domain-containing protein [Protomyces lactucae-debilis]ORY87575.1 hemolysin-III related-domain-containing protein [Protomyces lactucae-debilis]
MTSSRIASLDIPSALSDSRPSTSGSAVSTESESVQTSARTTASQLRNRTERPSLPLPLRRRTFNGRRNTDKDAIEESVALLKLGLVLDRVERKLSQLDLSDFSLADGKLAAAYDTLRTIFKDSACRVGGEAKGRALVVIKLLESKCAAVLSTSPDDASVSAEEAEASALPERIHGARKFLEHALHEIEHSYYARFHEGRQSVLEKISHLQEEISRGSQEAAARVAAIKQAVATASTRLLSYSELPFEWRNNDYIKGGYRFYASPVQCACSAFQIHNETGNIWTHLAGFMFLCGVGLWAYPRSPAFSEMTFYDRLIFFVFLAAALKCLGASALWHTFAHIANLKAMKKLACMDYVGISVLIAASIVTMEYHGFYCDPWKQLFYVGFTSALGVLGTIIPWFEFFDKVENRGFKICFFLGIAFSGIVPITHIVLSQSASRTLYFFAPVIKSLLCYTTGVAVYASRFPEKWRPGTFDLFLNSHNLWHLMVFGGIWYHFKAVQGFHTTSRSFACQAAETASYSEPIQRMAGLVAAKAVELASAVVPAAAQETVGWLERFQIQLPFLQ